jgi:radical SAM superfamily enzyme
MNPFPYAEDKNKRYHSWNFALRQEFGEKIFKVPIDAGFDCPNRDGTVAKGGCTFCSVSGSGDMIVAPEAPLPEQFEKEIAMMHKKVAASGQIHCLFSKFYEHPRTGGSDPRALRASTDTTWCCRHLHWDPTRLLTSRCR